MGSESNLLMGVGGAIITSGRTVQEQLQMPESKPCCLVALVNLRLIVVKLKLKDFSTNGDGQRRDVIFSRLTGVSALDSACK